MDADEIAELRSFYVAAARRAEAAGFDIVTVYAAHGHSITQQFLEPFYNKRDDAYGGSLENRARFLHETVEEVAEAVGDSCAVAVRLCLDALRPGGLTIDDAAGVVKLLDGLVDVWDFAVGGVLAEWGEDTLSSRFAGEHYERDWLERVAPHATKPVVGVGRFSSPDTMVAAIAEGHLDLIGSARGSIADPFLPSKIEEGRSGEIRTCIGCNVCAARTIQGTPIDCVQNPTTGQEYARGWHPERFESAASAEREVLVVGAGPAGLECALVLARRGMEHITLVDAADEPGGTVRWVSELPGLGEWQWIVTERVEQLAGFASVELRLGQPHAANDVLNRGAPIGVVASGSTWALDGLNGTTHAPITGADAGLAHVLTPEQVMLEGKEPAGDSVVVLDCDGYYMGAGLAERLAREGSQVRLVTPFLEVAPFLSMTLEGARVRRTLVELGVGLVSGHMVTVVEPDAVKGVDAYGRPVTWQADAVVLVTQRVSRDGLYRELRSDPDALAASGIESVYRIGDCVAPRLLTDAVFDGHRLAREIDAADPTTPLPTRREAFAG